MSGRLLVLLARPARAGPVQNTRGAPAWGLPGHANIGARLGPTQRMADRVAAVPRSPVQQRPHIA